MMNTYEWKQLVKNAIRGLRQARASLRAVEAELANIQQAPTALGGLCAPSVAAPVSNPLVRIAIVNGRHLTDNEIENVKEDNYDVILDKTNSTLRYRADPERHSELILSDLQGIGPYRIRILAFMIDRFGTLLCADNVDDLLADTDRVANPEAFIKNISVLRQALGGGGRSNPYIQSVAAWESSRRSRERVYLLNPQWQYLLITRGKSQKSD